MCRVANNADSLPLPITILKYNRSSISFVDCIKVTQLQHLKTEDEDGLFRFLPKSTEFRISFLLFGGLPYITVLQLACILLRGGL